MIARVVTDVSGIDKEFDYLIPAGEEGRVAVGTEVRIPLGGRRVGGWVVALPEAAAPGVNLRPIARVRGVGPEPETVALCRWAAWRWAGKQSWFLHTASAGRAVTRLPPPGAGRAPARPPFMPVALPAGPGLHVVELAPGADPTPLVGGAAQAGPTLVVVPSAARAQVLAGRLRRAGGTVGLMPDDWDQARAGGCAVVVGTRRAAFAPCPGMAAVVVLDAHDEGLSAEGSPTWNALDVVAERAARAAVPVYAVTPAPNVDLLCRGPLTRQDRGGALAGWPVVEVIDRRESDPRHGLWSPRVVDLVRTERKVALILNRTGRIRLLACAPCGELARCEVCQASLASPAPGCLRCSRCGQERPSLCARCGSTRLRNLRVGVARAAEELEVLAGRPVGQVTGATTDLPGTDVLMGTEALLHRIPPSAGVRAVVFVDFDQELLAARMRAAQEAFGLVAQAARLVRGRAGRVILQTRAPDHPVVRAAAGADPLIATEGEADLRRRLRLPPFAAVAVVYGDAAEGWVAGLEGVDVTGPDGAGRWMVRATDAAALSDALASHPRPGRGVLRVAVDPARL